MIYAHPSLPNSMLSIRLYVNFDIYIYICIYIFIYIIYICIIHTHIFYIYVSACFLSPHSSFIWMLSGVKSTHIFSKCYIEKKRTIQTQVKFSSLLENWALYSSISWPSNLIKNVSCKCSLLWPKDRGTFLLLGEKEKTLYNWNLFTSEFPLFIVFLTCSFAVQQLIFGVLPRVFNHWFFIAM